MAESSLSRVRVGVVIAGGLVLLGFAIFSIGGGRSLLGGSEILSARFRAIAGLQAGAPVMLAGVRVGEVEKVGFGPNPADPRVVVTMRVDRAARERLHTDALAQISSMGLLGDKFVELSAGSPGAPMAANESEVLSREPVDYESLLQKNNLDQLASNIVDISQSMRGLLDQIENGHGLLSEMVRGQQGAAPGQQVDLATIAKTLSDVDRLSGELDTLLGKINHGEGLAGAIFSDSGGGRELLADTRGAMASLKRTSDHLDQVMTRFDDAHGVIPQLLADRGYANDVLGSVRDSSHQLNEILHKINEGKGTAGMMVNDPALYNQLSGLLSGGGWGLDVMRGFYDVTHPFAKPPAPAAANPAQ
ncbi:MAG TPA: MlaD family protein [Candidatus Binataceae bacterium]|nr:MlaD family protein [Candidatus Binataceae bacterium]